MMKKLLLYIVWPIIAGLVFAGVVMGVATGFGLHRVFTGQPTSPAATDTTGHQAFPAFLEEFSFRQAVEKAAPAVVSINFKQEVVGAKPVYLGNLRDIPIYRYLEDRRIDNSQGSGVIVSADGYIISALHIFNDGNKVVEDTNITITTNEGSTFEARAVAVDEANDLVLLKVDESGLPFLSVGNPRPLSVGDLVLAVGYPRNLGQSASLGIISALLSKDDSYLIQTDAAINPGNSGGALIDYEGNLIGINYSVLSESEGIGFATPANQMIKLLNAYLESGMIGYLGVTPSMELFQISGTDATYYGYLVREVREGSSAEMAGIQPGDYIIAMNDVEITEADGGEAFLDALAASEAGEEVEIRLLRDKREIITLKAIMGEDRPFLRLGEDGSESVLGEQASGPADAG